jgi:hypothetical protein
MRAADCVVPASQRAFYDRFTSGTPQPATRSICRRMRAA